MILPVTLCAAAASALIGVWLMLRCGSVRLSEKIDIGDGGNDMMTRRMRAHANFVENTPFFLILVAALELAGQGQTWLPYVAGLFILGRVAHAFGMDGGALGNARVVGILITMLTHLGLAVVAVLTVMGVM